jgi:hypothetical protein
METYQSTDNRHDASDARRGAQGRFIPWLVRQHLVGRPQARLGSPRFYGAVGALGEEIVVRHRRSPDFSGGIFRGRRGPIASEPSQAGRQASRRVEERSEQRSALHVDVDGIRLDGQASPLLLA